MIHDFLHAEHHLACIVALQCCRSLEGSLAGWQLGRNQGQSSRYWEHLLSYFVRVENYALQISEGNVLFRADKLASQLLTMQVQKQPWYSSVNMHPKL